MAGTFGPFSFHHSRTLASSARVRATVLHPVPLPRTMFVKRSASGMMSSPEMSINRTDRLNVLGPDFREWLQQSRPR